jgi:hypothetical protein
MTYHLTPVILSGGGEKVGEDGFQIWTVALNTLNKQLQIRGGHLALGLGLGLGFGMGLTTPLPSQKKLHDVMKCYTELWT